MEEQEQVRQRLADTLRFVVSQRLAPKVNGGRVMVSEIMGSSLRTRETILLGEGEVRNFHEIIEASSQQGWHSFEQSLTRLFSDGTITEETALLYSVNKSAIRRALDIAKKSMRTDDAPSGFRLQPEHGRTAAVPGQRPPPQPA